MTSKPNYRQIGVSGLTRYSGYIFEEFLPELRWPRAGKIYKEMSSNDPVIGAILLIAEMLIRKASWSVEPASDKATDKEAADFLLSCMNDMSTSWPNTINEILSMFQYGFSYHEVVYKIRRGPKESNSMYRSKYSDGRVGWKRIPVRAQDTIWEWIFADDGDIKGIVQVAPPDYKRVEIPLAKSLLFRTHITRDNPESKSFLRNAYRPWYFKKHIEEIEGIGIERDLAGFPTLTAPENLDLWNDEDPEMVKVRGNAEELIRNIRRDAEEGVLLPYGWKLDLLSTGSSRQFDTCAIVNRYDNRIAITMLSDIVLIGGDKTGSFALADTKKSLLAAALEAQIQNIADTFNSYAVPKLFEYNNFPNVVELPQIVPGQIETPDLREIALILKAMGVDISSDFELQNFVRKLSSMPTLTKGEFDKQQKEKEKMRLQITNKKPDENDPLKDPLNNEMEQSDLAYTGQ